MADAAPKKKTPWGRESELTKLARERQLEAIIDTRCALCDVGVHRSARDGILWFKKHEKTRDHKANLKRRKK